MQRVNIKTEEHTNFEMSLKSSLVNIRFIKKLKTCIKDESKKEVLVSELWK
jgi:hypothetical protein